MKRHFQAAFIACVTLISCGCSQSGITEDPQTETITEAETMTVSDTEASAVTEPQTETIAEAETMTVSDTEASAVTEPQTDSYIDDNELITEYGKERISEICEEHPDCYTGLFDFDKDSVPELYIVPPSDCETLSQCDVYNIASGEMIGSFTGYPSGGTTYLSHGDGCIYVHTFCEKPNTSRYEAVTKLTFADGKLSESSYIGSSAEADENGIFRYSYYKDGEASNKEAFQSKIYTTYTLDEVSVCSSDTNDITTDTAELYNDYISAKNAFGYTEEAGFRSFFIYRDFDGDGTYEAFAQKNLPNDSAIYFVKDRNVTKLHDDYPALHVYSINGLCIIQMLSNGMPCLSYGVLDGEPYESELSRIGMYPERWEYKTGVITVTNSAYDTTGTLGNRYAYGAHSFKPYWFYGEYDETENRTVYHEYGGSPITRDELENIDGYAEIFAEIDSIEGSIIKEIYRRGNGIVNINYMSPEGVPDVYTNHFVTILANEDLTRPTVISERTKVIDKEYDEFGIYLPALNDEIAVYPE